MSRLPHRLTAEGSTAVEVVERQSFTQPIACKGVP